MGERITVCDTFPHDVMFLAPYTSTVAALDGAQYIGPFTETQLYEFWFRVKSIRIQGSASYSIEEPPSSGSRSVDTTITRFSVPTGNLLDTEDDVMTSWGTEDPYAMKGGLYGSFRTEFDVITPVELTKDENGKYWIFVGVAGFSTVSDDAKIEVVAGGVYYSSALPTQQDFNSNVFVFSDGSTIPLALRLSVFGADSISGASASITITEWYPYATNAGTPAWDTATGLNANDGPAA